MLKNSTAALYIDGQLVNTVKVSRLVLVSQPALPGSLGVGVFLCMCVCEGVYFKLLS